MIMGEEAATKLLQFERRIRAQYRDLFPELSGLPPARKDGGFQI
jgi:hypothetical protein